MPLSAANVADRARTLLAILFLAGVLGLPPAAAAEEPDSPAASAQAPAPEPEKKPKPVEVGFEMRWRLEFRDNADQQPADDFDAFLGQRLRVHLLFRLHPHLSAYVEGQDVWLFGAESDKVIHNLGTNLHQAYLDWKPGGSERWELRAGRQELIYGEERLVGAFGWDNVGRSFDAARLRSRAGAWTSDFFWARLVDVRRAGLPHRPGNQDLYGGYFTRAKKDSPGRTELYALYLRDGLGIRLIARRLNEENMRTRRGGLWSMVTVRDILRNRTYLGTYSRFGVRVPASHPPLISSDDFRRVQERLDSRRPELGKRQTSLFLLSGLAYCGYCGNKMIGVSRRQRWQRRDGSERGAEYRYYQCESRTNRSLCDYHTRRAAALEEEVRQAILGQGQSSAPALPRAGDEAAVLAEAQAGSRRLRARLRRLDRRLEQHLDAVTRGRLSRERFDSLSLALGAEQLALEETLAEAERFAHQQASAAERGRRQERALTRLRNEWDRLPPLQRQALLRELLERVVVRDDGLRALLRP